MNVKVNASRNSETNFPKVERYFNDEGGISFEEIISNLVQETIECSVRSSYHDEKVNVATSKEGVA
ncbi:MAG TPA: hypothetical protein VNM45_12990 [Bacillus sp. (in: firmicutes)]|nr:hypothetical protein [Bacillus sp. (in: firmicutes)]